MKHALSATDAPGKLMLVGEHAVVYGYPCIVAAVNRFVQARVVPSQTDRFTLSGSNDKRFVQAARDTYRKMFRSKSPIDIQTASQITGYGLGSSAAIAVATIDALASFDGRALSKEELFRCAYASVLMVQKVASGFDVAASIWGGTIYFDGKTKTAQHLSSEALPLVVAWSGRKADTADLVARVAARYEKNKSAIAALFNRIGKEVLSARNALQTSDWKAFGACMRSNHMLLQQLGVSSPRLDACVEAAEKAGAYGAKLSGAGEGDCIIAVVAKEKQDSVIQALENAGGTPLSLTVGTAEKRSKVKDVSV